MKNFKNAVKLASLCALSLAILGPSTSFASETEALKLLNQLNNQMDQIKDLTGQKTSKDEKEDLPADKKPSTSKEDGKGKADKKEDKIDKTEDKKEARYITDLKDSFYNNDLIVRAIEDIFANYPNTIKGKEEKLVSLTVDSHDLKLQAADLIYSITGERIQVSKPRIPEAYAHLIR